jgi:hypothetical protein
VENNLQVINIIEYITSWVTKNFFSLDVEKEKIKLEMRQGNDNIYECDAFKEQL